MNLACIFPSKMNYRHGFHAGNFADVLKHAILLACLDHLAQKPKPFAVIDTHAGAGAYDLTGVEAQKTGEWREGVGRVWAADCQDPLVARYAAATRSRPSTYPGSPVLALAVLRLTDRLTAVEMHAPTAQDLAAALKGHANARIMTTDGYAALRRLLPPPERRGLVVIDPPFEDPTEFERLAAAIKGAYEAWSTGMILAWYPVKDPRAVERFEAEIAGAAIPDILVAGLTVQAPAEGLGACRVMLVNPPFTLHAALAAALPWLATALARGPGAAWHLDWLTPPQ